MFVISLIAYSLGSFEIIGHFVGIFPYSSIYSEFGSKSAEYCWKQSEEGGVVEYKFVTMVGLFREDYQNLQN